MFSHQAATFFNKLLLTIHRVFKHGKVKRMSKYLILMFLKKKRFRHSFLRLVFAYFSHSSSGHTVFNHDAINRLVGMQINKLYIF